MISDTPLISIVVVIVSDTTSANCDASHLEHCLASLRAQVDPPTFEVIVPHLPKVKGLTELKQRYPEVRFIVADNLRTHSGRPGGREHHDELRARGLAIARGEIIGLLEDHAIADPNWCARVAAAHRQPYAAIGGAIENKIDKPLNWGIYFCDFYRYQNPVPDGPSFMASDANVSYKRAALESIRPIWQEIFHETAVNTALSDHGETIALSSGIVAYQHRINLDLGSSWKERFVWGRSYAGTRCHLMGSGGRLLHAAVSPLLPALLTLRIGQSASKKGHAGVFLKALPAVLYLTTAWSLGELTGYLTARANATGAPAGEAIARAAERSAP